MKFKDFIYSQKIGKTHTVTRIFGIKVKIRNGRWEMKIKRKEKPYDIGIISFNINTDISNYGAALHSYAFQKYLDKKGLNSVIINYYPESVKFYQKYLKILELYNTQNLDDKFILFRYFYNFFLKKIKFYLFFKKYCKITKYRYEIDTLQQLKNIKQFVCETDTTWIKFATGFDRGFLCDLPNMKKKNNVAYSIDFGSKNLNSKKQKELKKYAKNFKYISIRNVFKLDYFKNIIGRDDVEITIDPVFLLDQKDYLPIIKKPKIKGDYILVYNCKENNKEMMEKAEEYAKQKDLKLIVINCYDKYITNLSDAIPSLYSIEEFLGLIQNCKYFFTNSYHGICFAIIFNIQFIAFSRHANNEKILTVLEIFNLKNRFYKEDFCLDEIIDFNYINNNWNILRANSEKFIEKALQTN